jgi:tetratricopeptide (TPR) repeat protein
MKRLTVSADSLFDAGKTELNEASAKTLFVLGPIVRQFGRHPVFVEARSYSETTAEANRLLSDKQARSVVDWLVRYRCAPGLVSLYAKAQHASGPMHEIEPGNNSFDHESANTVDIIIDTCTKVVEADPSPPFPSTDYNEGVAAIAEGAWDRADQCFQRALAINGDDIDAHFQSGLVKNRLKRFAAAREELNSVLTANPLDAEAVLQLGIACAGLNLLEESVKAFRRAIELAPGRGEAVYQLAMAYKALGDRENFLKQRKVLEKLDPDLAGKLGARRKR